MNTVEERAFNPSAHILQISTSAGKKDYLPVQWRLVWLRSVCPEAAISTELLHLDMDKEVTHETTKWNDQIRKYEKVTLHGKGVAVFKATVKLPSGAVATGTKSESAAAFADYIEKAETGAIGRALAALGFGTQFTGDELDEGNDRIADAPVTRTPSTKTQAPTTELSSEAPQQLPQPANVQPMRPKAKTQQKQAPEQAGRIVPGQINALLNLYGRLDLVPPEDLDKWSFAQAAATIQGLQSQLKQAS